MTYWLDYRAARLTGPTIKAAGYTGTVRYIGAGSTDKRIDATEYRSQVAAGLTVLLVCQGTTTDADGGYARGAAMAKAAVDDAKVRAPGYTGPIFFTNDRPTLASPATWRAYLDGAASVLGRARVGAYGFANAMDAAVGHATYFWQAGRRADVRPHVHLWQDNNVQVQVGGITCDRNLVLKPIVTQEDDVELTDRFDEDAITKLPGSVGHAFLNIKQNADAARDIATAARSDVAAFKTAVLSALSALDAKVAKLQPSTTTVVNGITDADVARVVKAVNDDEARRMQA